MRIISWNINGLGKHFNELRQLTEAYSPDLVCIHWNGLTDEWYPFRDTKMQDYVRKEIEPINEDDIE